MSTRFAAWTARKINSFAAVLFALVWLCASAVAAPTTEHLFTFDARKVEPAPKQMYVTGSFAGWNATAVAMTNDGTGVWSAKIALPDGVVFYKFTADGNKWFPDPVHSDKDLEESDGYGGKNSAVMIGADARKLPKPVPDKVNIEGLLFDPSSSDDVDVASENMVRFRVRAQSDDVMEVLVNWKDETGMQSQKMSPIGAKLGYTSYATAVETKGKSIGYWLTFYDNKDKVTLEKVGARQWKEGASMPDHPEMFALSMEPKFTTPEWAKNAVWYQIFPERFRNGDSSNDPANTFKWQSKWFDKLPGESGNFYGKDVWMRRFGGDIAGLKQSLPYLRELGITAIYLNPMFEAESMHKYDATDYRHIDDNFGKKGDYAELRASGKETEDPATWQWTETDKMFLDFVAEAHKQGFKVILDGVFNHVGREHWAFQDVLKNGKESKYAGWFEVTDWNQPIKYRAWDKGEPTSDGSLPVFKKNAETGLVHGPYEHIMAVTKRWLAPDGDASRGVDGWRLDVPQDVPSPFWVEWRKLVKSTKPDAYISGEIWSPAQPWLQGDQFDAVMNYQFAMAAQSFFVNQKLATKPSEFATSLNRIANLYPYQSQLVLQNLFDSHDTDRLASMFVNPDLAYDQGNRIQDNGKQYSSAKPTQEMYQRMSQAMMFQMTFLGAPMVYYGDENGMWGPDDPSDRMPMTWRDLLPYDDAEVKFDEGLFKAYQRGIAIRETLGELRGGWFCPILTEDGTGVVAFQRGSGLHAVYVVINRSGASRSVTIPLEGNHPDNLIDWNDPKSVALSANATTGRPELKMLESAPMLRVQNDKVTVTVPAWGTAVLARPVQLGH